MRDEVPKMARALPTSVRKIKRLIPKMCMGIALKRKSTARSTKTVVLSGRWKDSDERESGGAPAIAGRVIHHAILESCQYAPTCFVLGGNCALGELLLTLHAYENCVHMNIYGAMGLRCLGPLLEKH